MERHLTFMESILNIVKIGMLPKFIYRFKTMPTKIPTAIFAELENLVLKFMWDCKKP